MTAQTKQTQSQPNYQRSRNDIEAHLVAKAWKDEAFKQQFLANPLVLVTKYRKKAISEPVLNRLHKIFTDTLQKWGCQLIEFNGESGHIHALIDLKPDLNLSH